MFPGWFGTAGGVKPWTASPYIVMVQHVMILAPFILTLLAYPVLCPLALSVPANVMRKGENVMGGVVLIEDAPVARDYLAAALNADPEILLLTSCADVAQAVTALLFKQKTAYEILA